MSEHPNAAVIRGMLDAMNNGQMDVVAAAIADDVEWHEIGATEAIHGKAALAERFGTDGPPFDITTELHDIVANNDHVVALVKATARQNGRTLSYRTAEIFHLVGGKVTERWAFSDDTEAINAFFA